MRIPLPRHLGHGSGLGPNPFQGRALHYDRVARRVLRGPYRRIAADAVAGLPDGASVLDVGTGPGWLLVEMARLRPDLRVTGVDLASDMAETARGHLAEFGERATAVVGDVRDLPFEDDTFDLVVASLSLHHWADPAAGGAEVARVLRPAGQVRVYDARWAPYEGLRSGMPGRALESARFPLTRLGFPALRRVVL